LAIGVAVAKLGTRVLLAKTDQPHPRVRGTVYNAAADIETAGGKAVAVVAPNYNVMTSARGARRRKSVGVRRPVCCGRVRPG
jgi:hypothetical protein